VSQIEYTGEQLVSIDYNNFFIYRNEDYHDLDVFFLFDGIIEDYELLKIRGDYFENPSISIKSYEIENSPFTEKIYCLNIDFDLDQSRKITNVELKINGEDYNIPTMVTMVKLTNNDEGVEIPYFELANDGANVIVDVKEGAAVTNVFTLGYHNSKYSFNATEIDYDDNFNLNESDYELVNVFDSFPFEIESDLYGFLSYDLYNDISALSYLEEGIGVEYLYNGKKHVSYKFFDNLVNDQTIISELQIAYDKKK